MTALRPGPISSSELISRPKRAPRKLNYESCTFCRKSKTKCLPERRSWPEKCRRCSSKNLECSAPHRKNFAPSAHDVASNGSASLLQVNGTLEATHNDIDSLEAVHDALHHILGLAVAELKRIGNELLPPLRGDWHWSYHADWLNQKLAGYRSFLSYLSVELESTSHAVARAVLLATMDTTRANQYFGNVVVGDHSHKREATSNYTAERHYGIEYILQMHRLQHKRNPHSFNIRKLLKSRQDFVSQIADMSTRHGIRTRFEDFKSTTDVDLAESQLFIPRELFQIPALVKAIEQDGRRDLLGRSVGHMFYDNKVVTELSHEITNGYDVLGRTRRHMICVTGRCEQRGTEALSTLEAWTREKVLGLDALHLAAIHGNTEILRLARASHCDLASRVLTVKTFQGRTCLHWAAAYGHLEFIECLLELFLASGAESKRALVETDGYGDTALHLAAQHGHMQVVEFILQHTDREQIMSASESHTPFWSAARGRHVNIMKLLEPISNFNTPGVGSGRSYMTTPLAEAAREGFLEGVEYLLGFQKVDINSRHFAGFGKYRTPLDFAIDGGYSDCVEFMRARGALTWEDIKENLHNDDGHN